MPEALAPIRVWVMETHPAAQGLWRSVLDDALLNPTELLWTDRYPEGEALPPAVDLALVDLDAEAERASGLLQRLPRRTWRVATVLFDDDERLLPALRAGIHGFLIKQSPAPVLVEHLQRILQGRPLMPSALARRVLEQWTRPADEADPLWTLLEALGQGLSPQELGVRMGLGRGEVDRLLGRLYEQLGAGHAGAAPSPHTP